MNTPVTPNFKVLDVVRLRPDVYTELEKRFPINVQRDTTAEQVAFSLGQQSVLKALREGYVINV